VREKVTIDNMQFGFMGSKRTADSKTVAGKVHSEEKKNFGWHSLILRQHLTEYRTGWSGSR